MNNKAGRYPGTLCLTKIITIFILGCFYPGASLADVLEEFAQTIETIDKRDGSVRSTSEVSMTRHPGKEDSYHLTIRGKGHFAGYLNVRWLSEAVLRSESGVVFVENSATSIYSGKQLLAQYQKDYDHHLKRVSWKKYDSLGKVISSREFPIKGPICDDVTMVYVFNALKPVEQRQDGGRFYLLTNEPKYYQVIVRPLGQESVGPKSRERQAVRFQLYADLGALTKLALKMVPSTYVWVLAEDKGSWVRYEGMETGYETAYVETHVTGDTRFPGSTKGSGQS